MKKFFADIIEKGHIDRLFQGDYGTNFENACYGWTRNLHVLLIRHVANVYYRGNRGHTISRQSCYHGTLQDNTSTPGNFSARSVQLVYTFYTGKCANAMHERLENAALSRVEVNFRPTARAEFSSPFHAIVSSVLKLWEKIFMSKGIRY